MVRPEVTFDGLFLLILSVGVLYLWTDNLLNAYRDWYRDKDRESFRAFLMGVVIWVTVAAFLFGAIALILPTLVAASRFFGAMARGALLVVGIWSWVLWRRRR